MSTKEGAIIKEHDQEIEERREKEQQPYRWTNRETRNQITRNNQRDEPT